MVFEAEIEDIFIDRQIDEPVVMLKEQEGDRRVPIWIQMGEMFALAIYLAGEAFTPPRPFSHDLIKTIVTDLDAHVHQVVIADIKDHIYIAQLHLVSSTTSLELDARPSDAILLALKFEAPIFIDETVVQKSLELSPDQTVLKQRLQKLRPEDFIKFAK